MLRICLSSGHQENNKLKKTQADCSEIFFHISAVRGVNRFGYTGRSLKSRMVKNWKVSLVVRSWKQLVGESGVGWKLRITEVVISYSATNIENVFFKSKHFPGLFFAANMALQF